MICTLLPDTPYTVSRSLAANLVITTTGLSQIVRERDISSDELAEQTAHARLMISHQFREGMVIIIEKNAGDEVCIG